MSKNGNVCKQQEESTSERKIFCADHKELCYRDHIQDTVYIQCINNPWFMSGPKGLQRDSITAQKPHQQRSLYSGKTTAVQMTASERSRSQEGGKKVTTYHERHSFSCYPAGKQAYNPNKEKQTMGKNLAQDQWQQQAARFVSK